MLALRGRDGGAAGQKADDREGSLLAERCAAPAAILAATRRGLTGADLSHVSRYGKVVMHIDRPFRDVTRLELPLQDRSSASSKQD